MAEEKTLTFMNLTIDDIIDWCKENGEVEWLKEEAAKKVKHKVYPRHKVQKEFIDKKTGKTVVKTVSVMDKTAEPLRVEEVAIPFTNIKADFCDKFMPELTKGKKKSKETFYDKIANL